MRPREGVRIERAASADEQRRCHSSRVGRRTRAARRPARHPAVGAVRLELNGRRNRDRLAQEGTERGFDVPGRARRPCRRPAAQRRRDRRAVVQNAPDNAAAFCRWITGADAGATDEVSYTVFGCGNTEWAATYQAVPTLLDTQLEAHGGRRIHAPARATPPGTSTRRTATGTAASGPTSRRRWTCPSRWPGRPDRAAAVDHADQPAAHQPRDHVLSGAASHRAANLELIAGSNGKPPDRSTRHLEVALPADVTYNAGDHLGVLPRNIDLLRRVMTHFGLDAGQYATIIPRSETHTHLPIDEPAPLLGVLGSCVELQDVASRDDIATLARFTDDPAKAALEALTGDDEASQQRYRDEVYTPNRSVLDLLEAFPGCAVPFEEFLDMLPPLRPRYYSISSSPLVDADACITAGVLRGAARAAAPSPASARVTWPRCR